MGVLDPAEVSTDTTYRYPCVLVRVPQRNRINRIYIGLCNNGGDCKVSFQAGNPWGASSADEVQRQLASLFPGTALWKSSLLYLFFPQLLSSVLRLVLRRSQGRLLFCVLSNKSKTLKTHTHTHTAHETEGENGSCFR